VPKGNRSIRGSTLDLLKEIGEKGYFFQKKDRNIIMQARTLKQYFPINKASAWGMTVWFHPDKARLAMEALVKRRNKRVLDARELGRVAKAFGIILERKTYHKKQKGNQRSILSFL